MTERRTITAKEIENLYRDVQSGASRTLLRDSFASAALSNPDISACAKGGANGLAALCYEIADAMLKAREK